MVEQGVRERSEVLARIPAWIAACQKFVDARKFANDHKLEIDPNGKRYIRIIEVRQEPDGRTGRNVFAFIDTTNGDVRRADGWKRPADKARGNLFDASNGLSRVNGSGPH
jgi:hypothetical protein